ncbi:DUF45 domain-containing protein [sulfur-oxidizing endosymbiont of Gigantopelta aegis]|uniref:DUF45 domain-containing protein n=1 Tax=sulfur-oxidizing endosymbiont of Gigantopelta aegis TaxID=2794934 RepID=UPI001BE43648|nr:DUF45 domain-containing protein [sulfur-oxidizing endosymbiont of Gigantopelta aegis]
MLSSELTLENYTIRWSKRAKYIRLTVSLEKGIVVVVPATMSEQKIQQVVPQFINEKQSWLQQAVKNYVTAVLRPDQLMNVYCLKTLL